MTSFAEMIIAAAIGVSTVAVITWDSRWAEFGLAVLLVGLAVMFAGLVLQR